MKVGQCHRCKKKGWVYEVETLLGKILVCKEHRALYKTK
jgi:hypothetical protein